MNINLKYFLLTCLFFLLGQTGIWFQLNAQFMWDWAKRNTLIMSVIGVPFTYIFILATGYGQKAFMGLMWPQRFLGFSIGIIIFAILSHSIMDETINFKTMLSLFLSFLIILVQLFIK